MQIGKKFGMIMKIIKQKKPKKTASIILLK